MRKSHPYPAQSRYRRARRWVDNALLAVVIALFGAGPTAVFSGHYQLRPVLSSSMEPMLPVGGVVVTERVPMSTVRAGDVVVFHRPDQPKELMVHRIIALTPGATGPVVQTRGDANRVADPWKVSLRGPTAYRVVFAVPLVGYVAVWVHSPAGRDTLILVGLLLVAGAGAGALIHLRRWPETGLQARTSLGPMPARRLRATSMRTHQLRLTWRPRRFFDAPVNRATSVRS